MAFSGLGLTKVIRFANGASIITSTVSRSVTTNTKFKVGADIGVFGGRYVRIWIIMNCQETCYGKPHNH